jgi:hypothetical protein
MLDFLANAFPGLAVSAGLAALYLAGKAGLPRLVSAGAWVKSKFAGAGAKLEQFDGEIGELFARLVALESQVARLAKGNPTGVVGAAVEEIKTAAQNLASDPPPIFLQPKPAAPPAPPAAAPQPQQQA